VNVTDAAYATVHDYPGGSDSLAPRLGTSGAVLRNKVNPNNDRNTLALEEADQLMGISGDYRILQALAANHGFLLQRADGNPGKGSADTILTCILALSMREGALSEIVSKALADNLISPREKRDIEAACHALQAAVIDFARCLPSAPQEGAPA
jgi:hypothetical protein